MTGALGRFYQSKRLKGNSRERLAPHAAPKGSGNRVLRSWQRNPSSSSVILSCFRYVLGTMHAAGVCGGEPAQPCGEGGISHISERVLFSQKKKLAHPAAAVAVSLRPSASMPIAVVKHV